MQIGDVDFDTAAQDSTNFVFAGVANPEEVVDVERPPRDRAGLQGLGDEPRRLRQPDRRPQATARA